MPWKSVFRKGYWVAAIVLVGIVASAVMLVRHYSDGGVALDVRRSPQHVDLDYGTMLAGESRVRSFAVKNTTEQVLDIIPEIGCRCTHVSLSSTRIQPSETASAKVTFDTSLKDGMTGSLSERFALRAKNAEGEFVAVVGEVKAVVEPSLEIIPRRLAWRIDESGGGPCFKQIEIANHSQSSLTVKWRGDQDQGIRLGIEPREFRLGPQGRVVVNVTLLASTAKVTGNAVLECYLDSAVLGKPDTKLTHAFEIAAIPVRAVTSTPSSLLFDESTRSKSFRVSCADTSRPFKITEMRSTYGHVSLGLDVDDNIRAELVDKSTSGMMTDEVIISYSIDGVNSTIRIPVLVTREAR